MSFKTHYQGRPLRKVRKSFEAYDKHTSNTVYTVLLECGHGIIGVPPSTVQVRKNGIACFVCAPVESERPEKPVAQAPATTPATRKTEPSIDLSENRALLQQILEGLRGMDMKLNAMDQRITEVEEIKTAPTPSPVEPPSST